MGLHIKSPTPFREEDTARAVFLAGGISNCPDWQESVAERISTETHANAINPRRVDFNMAAYHEISRKQIAWEYKALRECPFVLFWFPEEALCPIALFELGSVLERFDANNIYIGTDIKYQRRFDIIEQIALTGKPIEVYDSCHEMVDDLVYTLSGLFPHS